MAQPSQQSPPSPEVFERERAVIQSSPGHNLATGVGIALIAASIGTMLLDAFTSEDNPPEIVLHVEKVQQQQSGKFVVLFRAENKGNSAAADVSISGEIEGGSGDPETSQATLDYVPAKSERRGGLFFNRDPRQARLELRATGFQEP